MPGPDGCGSTAPGGSSWRPARPAAETSRLVDEHLASLDNAKHAEVYVGLPGSRPPMAKGDESRRH